MRRVVPGGRSPQRETEKTLNAALEGYPRNHTYRVWNKRLVPGVRLYRRWRQISSLYPDRVSSLLDVASCKGFFVFSAARTAGCERAVGIDCVESFVKVAEEVREYLGESRARFHVTSLASVADRIDEFGGPFDVVLLLNAYHYLFWGSELDPTSCRDHGKLLQRLATVCGGRVIFTSPLEIDECPGDCRKFAAAATSGEAAQYTKAHFLAAAEAFFDVREVGRWGKRPVLSMLKRSAGK
jgi:hypothetical protein